MLPPSDFMNVPNCNLAPFVSRDLSIVFEAYRERARSSFLDRAPTVRDELLPLVNTDKIDVRKLRAFMDAGVAAKLTPGATTCSLPTCDQGPKRRHFGGKGVEMCHICRRPFCAAHRGDNNIDLVNLCKATSSLSSHASPRKDDDVQGKACIECKRFLDAILWHKTSHQLVGSSKAIALAHDKLSPLITRLHSFVGQLDGLVRIKQDSPTLPGGRPDELESHLKEVLDETTATVREAEELMKSILAIQVTQQDPQSDLQVIKSLHKSAMNQLEKCRPRYNFIARTQSPR